MGDPREELLHEHVNPGSVREQPYSIVGMVLQEENRATEGGDHVEYDAAETREVSSASENSGFGHASDSVTNDYEKNGMQQQQYYYNDSEPDPRINSSLSRQISRKSVHPFGGDLVVREAFGECL